MPTIRKWLWKAVLAVSSNTLGDLSRLTRWERLDSSAAAALQHQRLTRLVRHAHAHVPWYRQTLAEAGVVSGKGQIVLEHWTNLPLLTKDMLRSHTDRLTARNSDPSAFWNTSGGSTGEPVRILQDKPYRDMVRAVAMLFYRWAGYEFGFPQVKIWGSERDLFEGAESPFTRLVRWLRNEHWFNAFRMSQADMLNCLDVIDRIQPVLIVGYVESLLDLARLLLRKERSMHRPAAVMTAAGPLDSDARDLVKRASGAPVFDRYGSREVGDVASECESHAGLHVCMPTHFVEILRSDGQPSEPGERGELVITSLTNYSMPLIRYQIGDISAWRDGGCPCGRAWPLIERVVGRVSDIFVRADGTHVHGEYFTHLFYRLNWVRKFQVIQESLRRIEVHVVPVDKGDNQDVRTWDLEEVRRKIRLVMGEECVVDFTFRTAIDPMPSGKYRYTISRITA